MNYKTLIIILAIVCSSCLQTDKKTRSEKVSEIEGRTFYIETVDFGSDLNSCFGYTIFNKWSSLDFHLEDSSHVYTGKDPKEKHFFSDIKNFNESMADQEYEKIVVRLKGDWTIKNTKYSIERYKYDGNGNWQRIVNLGDFMTRDRVNDFISPNQLDVDELCEQIVATTVKASYK